jgi:hypothetical protein
MRLAGIETRNKTMTTFTEYRWIGINDSLIGCHVMSGRRTLRVFAQWETNETRTLADGREQRRVFINAN